MLRNIYKVIKKNLLIIKAKLKIKSQIQFMLGAICSINKFFPVKLENKALRKSRLFKNNNNLIQVKDESRMMKLRVY